MPQMLSIQPSGAQTPPNPSQSGSPANEEQSQFSPLLENAISSNKPQRQATQDKSEADMSPATNENILATENDQEEKQQIPYYIKNLVNSSTTEDMPVEMKEKPKLTSLAPLYTKSTQPITSSIFSKPQQVESSTSPLPNAPVPLNPMQPIAANKQDALMSQLEQIIANANETGAVSITKATNTSAPQSIISQLEQIVANANENGTVSITKAKSTSTPHFITGNTHSNMTASVPGNSGPIVVSTTAETSEINLNSLPMANIDGIEKTAGKPAQQLSGIRHDSQQLYYNAKVNSQNSGENNQNFQENHQGENLSQQASNPNQPSSPLGVTEQTNTFSQISSIVTDTNTQLTSESAKPVILPSGSIVQEEQIIHQLTQRLQISSKNMDSRINIKLHPVELGELKIDLTLKEGAIRANVVAQSQQTLEILEKNIPKLKTMLENQGFTIDEISVTAESDSVGDFNHFDQQLFHHNDDTPTAPKSHQEDEAIFTLDDSEFAAPETSTGVNVKI